MTVNIIYSVTDKKGDEIMKTGDKKYADWYDKRIESGYKLCDFLNSNLESLPEELRKNDVFLEEMSIFLSMHSNKITKILKGKQSLDDIVEEESFDEFQKKK